MRMTEASTMQPPAHVRAMRDRTRHRPARPLAALLALAALGVLWGLLAPDALAQEPRESGSLLGPATQAAQAAAAQAGLAARSLLDPPVLSLSASASRELPNDRLVVVLYAEREAADAAGAQAQVNALITPALEVLRAARPALEIESSGWRTWPINAEGRIRSWRARASVMVRGEPSPALAALIGQLGGTLVIESLRHELSRPAREAAEADLLAVAAANFQSKAQAGARALGYREANLRSVSLNQALSGPPVAMMRTASAPMLTATAAPITSAEGNTTVSVTLEGSVWLGR
jgi:predicted secreted protein